MENKYIKKWSILAAGLFLLSATSAFAQIDPNPSSHKVTLDKSYSEHGYNKNGVAESPREDIDTVMVGSNMTYFVMPDSYYNKTYFAGNDYKLTNLTTSKFEWTVPAANGTAAVQTPNGTGTSPWVKINWTAVTASSINVTMVEKPQGLTTACDGDATVIPIFVIKKPTIEYNQVGSPLAYTAAGCYTDVTKLLAEYDFGVTISTQSSQVLVDCSITWKKIDGTTSTYTETDVPVNSGSFNLKFTDYGDYEVTITKITDRIARKCEVTGDITAAKNKFAYSVLPQPKAGKAYHVPNNF